MAGQSARPLTGLEWGNCDDAYRFLSWIPNRLLYLVVPFIFLAGLAAPYLFSCAAGGRMSTRVIATAVIFGLGYSAAYLSWLYYGFLTAVWQLWRQGCIERPPVPRQATIVKLR